MPLPKTATNPSGAKVTFDPERHVYSTDSGHKLVSGTQFVSKFFKKFEKEKMAQRCVGKPKYAGKTAEQIKAEWDAKGARARTEGTNLHAYCEALLIAGRAPEPKSEREAKLFQQAAMAVMEIEEQFEFIGAEMIVFSERLRLAGMIDLLVRSPRTGNVVIMDWKQNEEIRMDNPWQKCLPPIEHLDDCDATRYGLQLSTYEAILRVEEYFTGVNWSGPEVKGFGRALVHVTEDAYRVWKMPDLRGEVESMARCSSGWTLKALQK